MLTLRQFCASLCCFGGGHAKENHASIFIASGCDVFSFFARLVWMRLIAAHVASIALFAPGHRFVGRHDRLMIVGRVVGGANLASPKFTSCSEPEAVTR